MYRCREACRGGMVACATCILVGHWEAPLHRLQVWNPGSRIWEPATLRQLGFIFQEGHQGLPCPNPAPTTTTKLLRTSRGEIEQICRATHQKHLVLAHHLILGPSSPLALLHACLCWDNAGSTMKIDGTDELEPLDGTAEHFFFSGTSKADASKLSVPWPLCVLRETEEEKETCRAKNRETQRRYRERCRERIAHRARRAIVRRNAAAGKETKLRPKTRQYYSDPELLTEEEGE
ncbi:hypothetical protein B0H14DRAFT_2627467 [Mycena olivaceomarginata]|nr:hypothetical protein B0H14DRAFT_2627467 [Mycena olivaceomarginata]